MAKIFVGSVTGGGGGVTPNPTSGVMPVNNAGLFVDSLITSTIDVGNGTSVLLDDLLLLIDIVTGSNTGIKLDGNIGEIIIDSLNGIHLKGGVFIDNHLGDPLLRFLSSGASDPSLKANATTLEVRNGNDTNYLNFRANDIIAENISYAFREFNFTGKSILSSNVNANITLYNQAKTSFGLLQFGGISNSYPALKRSSTELQVRLADDSNFANIRANNLITEAPVTSTNTSMGFRCNNGATNLMLLNLTGGLNINLAGATTNNASAILQADSTTKGFLPPRMTQANRTAIVNPAIGLMVYQNDPGNEGLYVYKTSGWTLIV